jgi:hypothetical protein
MDIEQWWPKLKPSAKKWLIENNGDEVPAELVAEIAEAGGPGASDPWWGYQSASRFYFPDEVIDWIEAVANGEDPGP